MKNIESVNMLHRHEPTSRGGEVMIGIATGACDGGADRIRV